MLKNSVQQGRSERRPEAYPLGYVEDLNDARTPLADFFSTVLKTWEHVAYTCLDIPVIGSGKILPPHPDAWTNKHAQSSHETSTDFEFKGHTAFRIPFPIDLPDSLSDGPPPLGPERIDLSNEFRKIHGLSIRIAADRNLLGEHPDQERVPTGDKPGSSECWADGIFAKAHSGL
jgi:hypothetical protein